MLHRCIVQGDHSLKASALIIVHVICCTAVEERCQSILQSADSIAQSFMDELQVQLLVLPKKVREMLYDDYVKQQGSETAETAETAARLKIESKMQSVMQQSMAMVRRWMPDLEGGAWSIALVDVVLSVGCRWVIGMTAKH